MAARDLATIVSEGSSVDPFTFKFQLPWYRIPQIALMSVTIAPLKAVAFAALNVTAWLLANIMLIGIDEEEARCKPFEGWRRAMLPVAGFTFPRIKGKPTDSVEAPIVVCAPHSSFTDALALFLLNECPAVIAKYDMVRIPIIGKLLKASQPIFVFREDRNSKINVINEMKRRARSNGLWRQQFIFPEGTTTNSEALIPFKIGAFIPGKPVQPMTMLYTDEWNTVTWTWRGSPPGWILLWLSLCKLRVGLTVEFLPVYYPSEEEKNDPVLYANNVRQLMARSLKIPCSDLTYEDIKAAVKVEKNERPNRPKAH